MCSLEGKSLNLTNPACSQSVYGSAAAKVSLISSSSIIRPSCRSTKNILPGCNRPFRTIDSGLKSKTPTSLANTTSPSSVTQNLDGRKPLRSNTAPI